LVLHPTHFESTEPVSAQNRTPSTISYHYILKINKSFQPIHHPSTHHSQAVPPPKQTHPTQKNTNHQTTTTMSATMPGTYDPTLYPNLMRYRNPQPAPAPPPAPHPNGLPRHPLESLPNDEWRRCPLCWSTKLCVVLGRCVHSGKKVKVAFSQKGMDCGGGCAAR